MALQLEHIKDAATVIGQYCDVVAIRCFADLKIKNLRHRRKDFNAFPKVSQ